MDKDNLIKLKKSVVFVDDPIAEILRRRTRRLLTNSLETEIEFFVHQYNIFE